MQSRDVLRLVFNPSGSYIQVCPGSGLSHQALSQQFHLQALAA